jgi:hypothetical protein
MNASDRQLTYNSRESAYLSLLTSEVKTGHLYLKRYLNEEGKPDILMAYGVQDCTTGYPDSIDSLKIISGDSPFPVYNVVFHNPDVSELARGQVFLYVDMRDAGTMDCSVKLITIEPNEQGIYEKTSVDFGETLRRVYSLTQGEFYYVSNNTFRSDENKYTREEIDSKVDGVLNGELRPSIDELQRAVFPLSMNFSVSPTIAEKNNSVDLTLSYSVIRKEQDVTSECSLSLINSNTGEEIDIPSSNILRNVTEDSKMLTLTADYRPGYNISKDVRINFVYRSYWGVIDRELLERIISNPTSFEDQIEFLSGLGFSGLRTKGTLTFSNINLTLGDTVVYAYPAEYGNLSSIKDANGFEYITDYEKMTIVTPNNIQYNVYIKITPTVITGFKQIYSF